MKDKASIVQDAEGGHDPAPRLEGDRREAGSRNPLSVPDLVLLH